MKHKEYYPSPHTLRRVEGSSTSVKYTHTTDIN